MNDANETGKATRAMSRHGFKSVGNNGYTYEIACKCGQVWASKSRASLSESFDTHLRINNAQTQTPPRSLA